MVSIALVFALVAPCVSVQQHGIAVMLNTGVGFGPRECVRVTKSAVGSCVISTNCEGLDTSATEFAFNCVSRNGVKWHSFGVGGFESNEEFDSEVKCDLCQVSVAHHVQVAAGALPVFVQPSTHAPLTTASPKKAQALPTRAPQLPFGGAPLIHQLPVFMAPVAKSMPPAYPENSYRFLHRKHHKAPLAEQSVKQKHPVKHHKVKHHDRHAPSALGFFGRLRLWHHSVAPQKSEIVQASSFHAKQHSRKAEIATVHSLAVATNFWPFARSNSQPEAIQPNPEEAKYGPEDCVSTYRNSLGDCVVQTKCKGIDVSNYEFGLLCVDKAGKSVHHTFGMGSFDQEETFDTLIECDKCLGITDGHKEVVAKEVAEVSKDIAELVASAKDLSANVEKLNVAVFKAPAASPAGIAPASATPSAPAGVVAAVLIDKTLPPQGMAGAYVQKGSGNDDQEEGEDESDDEYDEEQVVAANSKAAPEVAAQKKVKEGDREEDTDEDVEESDVAGAVQEDRPPAGAVQLRELLSEPVKPQAERVKSKPELGIDVAIKLGQMLESRQMQKKEGNREEEADDDGEDDGEEEADEDEWRVERDDTGADHQERSKRTRKGTDRKDDEGVEFDADEAEREYKEEANQHDGKRAVKSPASDDDEDEDEVGTDDDDDNFR